jgi:hypothetical protein
MRRSPTILQIRLVLEDLGIPYAEKAANYDTWEEDKLVYTKYPFSQSEFLLTGSTPGYSSRCCFSQYQCST